MEVNGGWRSPSQLLYWKVLSRDNRDGSCL